MIERYTAQQMRDYADAIAADLNHGGAKYSYDDLIPVVEALRQAADMMEREKCDKKYEYCVKYLRKKTGACIGRHSVCYDSLEEAKMVAVPRIGEATIIIRREVGEWEEVKDGE